MHYSVFYLLLHFDTLLASGISQYGAFIYVLLFAILFCETGLFVPFLPGDSLIFACAAFSAAGLLNLWGVLGVCFVSAFLGDSLNYHFGYVAGKRLAQRKSPRFLTPQNIGKAHDFYEKHGGKAIILSRFIPVIRLCTPFVAGIGNMSRRRFFSLNLLAVAAWISTMSSAGYFLGNIPVVKDHFSSVILLIIGVSLLPPTVTYLKSRFVKN